MASQATITAKIGPGATATAQVWTGLKKFHLNLGGKNTLEVSGDQGEAIYDVNATTTLTCTITAGGNATIVVSQ